MTFSKKKLVTKIDSLYIILIFRCTAFSYLEGDPELAYFAVYDGHGGTGVANYLKDHCHEFILDQPEYKEGNIEESVLKAFLQVRHQLSTNSIFRRLSAS